MRPTPKLCTLLIYLARSAKWPTRLYVLPSVISIFFSPLRKLAGRAIYFTLCFFPFSLFLIIFLMISRRQIIWRSAGPIFAYFTSSESFLPVDDRSGPLFSISQGTLPWQPVFVQKWAKLPTTLHLSLCHSETEWAIVLRMSTLKAPLIALHRVKNGENRFSSFWVKPG